MEQYKKGSPGTAFVSLFCV
jgi:hypothetical protein